MLGRQSVWADPELQQLSTSFVPVMDEVFRLQEGGSDAECEYFRAIARQGHGGGRARTSQQGTYCFAPSGAFLGSDNTRDPRRMERLLRSALEKWKDLPKAQRLRTDDPSKVRIARAEDSYPRDGLVLRQFARDLPRHNESDGVWKDALNFDFVWFSAEEVRQMLPPLRRGERRAMPDALARRIVQLHLVDNVRGQAQPYAPQSVTKASMEWEVLDAKGPSVNLRLVGESSASQGERGCDAKLLGRATWDAQKSRFTSFELVAVGERWGGSNARREDAGRKAVGWVFTLAGDAPADRVAPAYFGAYGWRR